MEIKFRGLLLEPNFIEADLTWIYGNLNISHNGSRSIRYNLIDYVYPAEREVDAKTIGQYINLKDKNGQEIYVGDIGYLQTNWGERLKCVVEFNVGFIFSYRLRDDKKKCVLAQDVSLNKMEFEIIGNIHVNPELTL